MHRTKGRVRALWLGFGYALLALGLATPAHATCQLNSHSGKIKHVSSTLSSTTNISLAIIPTSRPTLNNNQTCSIL